MVDSSSGALHNGQTANLVVNGNFAQGGTEWPADLLKRKGTALR